MWKSENLAMMLPNYMAANRPQRDARAPDRYGFGVVQQPKPAAIPPVVKPPPAKHLVGKPKPSPTNSPINSPNNSTRNNKKMPITISKVDNFGDLDDILLLPTKSVNIQKVLRKLSCGDESCDAVELGAVFGYPKTFEHAVSVKRFGKPSANGFIHGIKYMREFEGIKVESNAVLKSSQDRFADNLVYEYLAGLFLNKYVGKVPSLIATFGLYKYFNEDKWSTSREFSEGRSNYSSSPTQSISLVCDALDTKNCLPDNICTQSRSYCLLIQNVKNGKSFEDVVQEYKDKSHLIDQAAQLKTDIMSSLLHVYFTLAQLHNKMTHYDLHTENVMLYKPFGDKKTIQYIYHFKNGEEITFTSEYLAKIIDYGRSYFSGAKELLGKIAISEDCNSQLPPKNLNKKPAKPKIESRGMESGFTFHNDTRCNDMTYYICPDLFNESHDLRLAVLTKKILRKSKNNPLETFDLEYKADTGTPSLETGNPQKVSNVREMLTALRTWFKSDKYASQIHKNSFEVVAVMNIYEDMRPMTMEHVHGR